jgi:hypothetical protein
MLTYPQRTLLRRLEEIQERKAATREGSSDWQKLEQYENETLWALRILALQNKDIKSKP